MPSEYFSIVAGTKTASPYRRSVDSCEEFDAEGSQAELRHRRRRHFSEDPSSQMIPFDDHESIGAANRQSESENTAANRRHSDTFGIESYRPSNAVKSTGGGDARNGFIPSDMDGKEENKQSATLFSDQGAALFNKTSPARAPASEAINLNNVDASNDDGDFIGEFIPRRGDKKKNDIELEPLLSGEEETTAFTNKAFSGDEDEKPSKSSPAKREKAKSEHKTAPEHPADSERALTILLQVSFPFFIAGCGTVGAGLVLDKVQHHRVFEEVPQIFILVPALLGLKGNLEMTLASRLSTLANLGRMDTKKEKLKQVVGNLALIQAQAAVIAFLASVFAIVLGWVPKGEFRLDHALLLCASSLATASLASLILGAIMVAVVLLSKTLHINPDNVATPIAASLGDLTTLSLLAAAGGLLINSAESFWLAPFIVAVFILLCPLWIWISAQNPVTREVLISGWSPVIFSMLISSAGGFILEYTVAKYRGIAVFQPVINGIGGNLVAVQASRISTSLHKESRLGVLPPSAPALCFNPCRTFFGSRTHSKAARVLLSLVIPGHLVFMFMIHFLRAGHTPITPLFAILYCGAALIQVSVLLYCCVIMINSMWKRKVDPDNSAIPYLTALGDLLGTALLAIAFHILFAVGDRDMDLGE